MHMGKRRLSDEQREQLERDTERFRFGTQGAASSVRKVDLASVDTAGHWSLRSAGSYLPRPALTNPETGTSGRANARSGAYRLLGLMGCSGASGGDFSTRGVAATPSLLRGASRALDGQCTAARTATRSRA
jgi:hypothetical protein